MEDNGRECFVRWKELSMSGDQATKRETYILCKYIETDDHRWEENEERGDEDGEREVGGPLGEKRDVRQD